MTRRMVAAMAGAVLMLGGPASGLWAQSWEGAYGGVQFGRANSGDAGVFGLSPLPPGGALETAFSPNEAVPDAGFFGEKAKGNVGGVQFGYDWQSGMMVYGAVGALQFGDVTDRQQGKSRTPAVYTIERKMDNYATLAGRVGYLAQPNTLVYGLAGVAMGKVDFAYSQPGSAATTVTSGGQKNRFGYVIGFGVENKVTEQVSIGLEYTYVNMGSNDFQATLTGGPFSAAAPSTTARGTDRDFDFGQVQLKMNYRF